MSEFDGRRLPPDLERGRSRIQAWREQGRPGGRVPEPLVAMAVRLAATHGLSRTATLLGVSYCGLKQRAELGMVRHWVEDSLAMWRPDRP
jgi:hypothetical protein